jgi:hypothetical protein
LNEDERIMTSARNVITLPERPLAVNSPTDNSDNSPSLVHKRCEARMRVVYDNSLSPGARLLYVALDDYAGMKGVALAAAGHIGGAI